jgi:ABC-2 type transport system permease protein
MNARAVLTVAKLELRQRARTSKWPLVLLVWVLIIGGVSLLTWYAAQDQLGWGDTLYDVAIFFVLALSMLVAPSLTATSINGDREHGVLATADIALGKLLAAWAATWVFLLAAAPFLVWGWAVGEISVGAAIGAVVVLGVVNAVVCALGLMFSALTARTISSAVLTYLSIAALTFGTVIAFLLSLPFVSSQEVVRIRTISDDWFMSNPAAQEPTAADCEIVEQIEVVYHSERTWWLLAMNPFVVVADVAPSWIDPEEFSFRPLAAISEGARIARLGESAPNEIREACWPTTGNSFAVQEAEEQRLREANPVWPLGFALLTLLGGGAAVIAARRLRTPARRLARGTRIA